MNNREVNYMIRNRLISNILVICLLVSVIPQRISAEQIYKGGNASAFIADISMWDISRIVRFAI